MYQFSPSEWRGACSDPDPSLGSYDLEESQANQSDTNNSDERKELYATLHGRSITGRRCSFYIIYLSSQFKGWCSQTKLGDISQDSTFKQAELVVSFIYC